MVGSSIVAGILKVHFLQFYHCGTQNFPERVFGSLSITATSLNAATGPILSRISRIHSVAISASGRLTPW